MGGQSDPRTGSLLPSLSSCLHSSSSYFPWTGMVSWRCAGHIQMIRKRRELFVFTCTKTTCPKQAQIPDISWCNGRAPSAGSFATAQAPAEAMNWSCFIIYHKRLRHNLDMCLSRKQVSLEIHQTTKKLHTPQICPQTGED